MRTKQKSNSAKTVRELKRHLASQGIYGGGKRPFGYDVHRGRLVPNVTEQAALARMRALREERKSLREISLIIADEFQRTMALMTIKRILDRSGQALVSNLISSVPRRLPLPI